MVGSSGTCDYHYRVKNIGVFKRCGKPSTHEYPGTWFYPRWEICEEHANPKLHPDDVARAIRPLGVSA